MFEKTIKLLDSFLDMGIPGYDCIIYRQGKEIFRRYNGYSDLENKTVMNGKERYNIYSCSKLITCAAALQLYEKGLFRIEDKLSDYMPEFKEMSLRGGESIIKAKTAITIENLFCMTAGFSYELNSPMLKKAKQETNGKCPTRKTMEYLAQEPLLFEPGTLYNYSLCHDVLAALVEVISEKRFSQYVADNIFAPLDMKYSTFLLSDSEMASLAEQYYWNPKTSKLENCGKSNGYRLGTEYESGGAGCCSTTDDYIKLLEALRKGNIVLKEETVRIMSTNRLSEKQLRTYPLQEYGYGLGVRCPKQGYAPTDFGWGGAAGAYFAIEPTSGISFFYVQHVLNSPVQDIRREVFVEALRECIC